MKTLLVIAIGLLTTACASTTNIPLNATDAPSLQGKSLLLVTRKSPSFIAMTSGKGMFAVAGVGAAASAGDKLVSENRIEDPAASIGQSLVQVLSSNFGLSENGAASANSDDINSIVALSGNSDYTLDVETTGWSFIYDGFNFSDYLVGYSAKTRLIDVEKGRVIAEGICLYDTKTAGKPLVTQERLLENNASYIKQALSDAVLHCVKHYKLELFSL